MAFFFPLHARDILKAKKPIYNAELGLTGIVVPAGTPVYAVEAGQVERNDSQVVLLFAREGQKGRAWLYSNISLIKEGPVQAGEQIATVGGVPGGAPGAGYFGFGFKSVDIAEGLFEAQTPGKVFDPLLSLQQFGASILGEREVQAEQQAARAEAERKAAQGKAEGLKKDLDRLEKLVKEGLKPAEPLKGGEVLGPNGAPVGAVPAAAPAPAPIAALSTGQKVAVGALVGGVAILGTWAVVRAVSRPARGRR